MLRLMTRLGERVRVLSTRLLRVLGLREESFLLVPAVLIGIVTAFAAVGFHELIYKIRDVLYEQAGPDRLYGRWMILLIAFPALGGLVVGIISRYIMRAREGHGIVDVIESVARTSGFIRPGVAVEKIVTSAVTIGTGGSGGAEGPIVQIGAAIASGVGQFFGFARHQMPIIIGCGSAAGISAIFNAPIGGVIFTIEVILRDFSIRAFTPLVVASVIANITTQAIFARIEGHGFSAIFAMPAQESVRTMQIIDWPQVPNFVFLGLICGIAGVALTKLMGVFEARFARLSKLGALRPAIGGALVGILGIFYVLVFGRMLLDLPKPFAFEQYPMPAFFGDGYGIIQTLLSGNYYKQMATSSILILLSFLCLVKILATCLTLASGGSGGIIAPSLFMGATAGGFLGTLLRQTGWFNSLRPEVYALVGTGAVLAAVVHAPLASILILFELTQDYRVTLPAMLATVVATGVARLVFPESIYTQSLKRRGVEIGSMAGGNILRRTNVEQLPMNPATLIVANDPAQKIFDLLVQFGTADLVVVDRDGMYVGMIVSQDINLALLAREALPMMVVEEFARKDVPTVRTSDDLASVFDLFSRFDVGHLPVCLPQQPRKIIGLVSRSAIMRAYQEGLAR